MKRKIVIYVLATMLLSTKLFPQAETFVNRVYQNVTGSPLFNPVLNPLGVQWSKTIASTSGGLIMVGYTSVSGQGQNIYLVKHASNGSIVFESNFNTSGTNNDYGLGVVEASNGDIYVCGATDNGGASYDLAVLRVNAGGTLIGSVITKDGPAGLDDIGASIALSSTGQVIIAGNTLDNSGFSDFWVLKYSNSLSFVSANTYDYAGLTDVALGVSITTGGDIIVIGPSASSATSSDYVQVNFNGTTLAYASETRNNIPGTALDQALDFCKDASDNTYITGKAWNGTNFDVKTIKINANMSIAWTATLNPYSMNDAGTSIVLDGSGNVIVGGYASRANGIKNLLCLKYNPSNGTLIWSYQQSSENISGDAAIKQVCTNPSTNDVYFIAVEENTSGEKQSLVSKLISSGVVQWQKTISDPTDDILPSDIKFDTDGVVAISILDSTINHYLTTKYSDMKLDTARTYKNGLPAWKKRELLITFLPTAINTTTINSEGKVFGNLNEFLTASAYTAVTSAFSRFCSHCDFKVVKVYEDAKTTETVAISRLGQNVPVPPLWSTLLIQLPSTVSNQTAQATFNSLKNVVSYAHPNYYAVKDSPPNDSLYNLQASIHAVSPYNNAHINVEDAWNVVQGCGASYLKCGVFDTGIEWQHKDFGYNGTLTSGKVNGWHFQNSLQSGVDIRTQTYNIDPDNDGHGTAVAGIIGAQRNNTSGVAGIAGGDGSNNNPGVKLYSLNMIGNTMYYSCKAIRLSAMSGGTTQALPYRYGLNFSNHSYRFLPSDTPADSVAALRDVFRLAYELQVTMSVSRGNQSSNNVQYPAKFDSTWVISVGGTGTNGQKYASSSYGSGIDVCGPANSVLVQSTNEDKYYTTLNGTSAAAPHAGGVVGLLMSYMNDTLTPYRNLAPEDCEFIINRSATDIGSSGYDSLTGYGRINAGAALRLVEKPYRWFYHYGTNPMTPHSITKSVVNISDTIRLTEKYTTPNSVVYNPGKYIVKTWQINTNVSHYQTQPTDSIMHFWPRHSMSHVFALPDAQKRLNLHHRVNISSCNLAGATLSGYIYQVKDSLGNQLGWWPCDTSFSILNNNGYYLMEYSVLSKNKAVGLNERNQEHIDVSVFPNPVSYIQNIVINSESENSCKIELFDLMGRKLRTVYQGKAAIGKTTISHNLEDLPGSLYIYKVTLGHEARSVKFIKE